MKTKLFPYLALPFTASLFTSVCAKQAVVNSDAVNGRPRYRNHKPPRMKTKLFPSLALPFTASLFTTACLAQTDAKLAGNVINQAPNIEIEVVAEPLDGRVNSAFIEYGPTLTKDGKRLY